MDPRRIEFNRLRKRAVLAVEIEGEQSRGDGR
jgi:hypothetical protein